MLLYHYTKLQYGLAAIRDKRLKIARYDALNDPFDIMGLAFSQEVERNQLDQMKTALGKTNGIICLSETWKEPLMWGHYADSHRGVCLGFEVRAGHYEKIHYRADRPTLATFKRRSIAELSAENFKTIAHSKFKQWEYEREWRRVVNLDNEDFVDGNYYLPFGSDESMKLKYVFFGMNCKIDEAKIDKIARANPGVKFAMAEPASREFDIIIGNDKTKKFVGDPERWVLNVPVPDDLHKSYFIELMMERYENIVVPVDRELMDASLRKRILESNLKVSASLTKTKQDIDRYNKRLTAAKKQFARPKS